MFFVPSNTPSQNSGTRYDHLVWLIFGAPMSGKSSFANSFPNPLWINTDGNHFQFDTPHIFLDKNGVSIPNPDGGAPFQYSAWEFFKHTVDELVEHAENLTYQTIIVDLVEDVYESCRAYICALHRKNHEQEIGGGFGQGYKLIEDEFMATMSKLASLRSKGFNILMLSHLKIGTTKTIDEKTIETQYETTIRSKIQDKLKGISHISGRTDKLVVTTQTDKGPVAEERFILRVSEPHSIASNRIFLPFNEIYLSYDGWRQAIGTITNTQVETPQEQEGENYDEQ